MLSSLRPVLKGSGCLSVYSVFLSVYSDWTKSDLFKLTLLAVVRCLDAKVVRPAICASDKELRSELCLLSVLLSYLPHV